MTAFNGGSSGVATVDNTCKSNKNKWFAEGEMNQYLDFPMIRHHQTGERSNFESVHFKSGACHDVASHTLMEDDDDGNDLDITAITNAFSFSSLQSPSPPPPSVPSKMTMSSAGDPIFPANVFPASSYVGPQPGINVANNESASVTYGGLVGDAGKVTSDSSSSISSFKPHLIDSNNHKTTGISTSSASTTGPKSNETQSYAVTAASTLFQATPSQSSFAPFSASESTLSSKGSGMATAAAVVASGIAPSGLVGAIIPSKANYPVLGSTVTQQPVTKNSNSTTLPVTAANTYTASVTGTGSSAARKQPPTQSYTESDGKSCLKFFNKSNI